MSKSQAKLTPAQADILGRMSEGHDAYWMYGTWHVWEKVVSSDDLRVLIREGLIKAMDDSLKHYRLTPAGRAALEEWDAAQ